MELQTLLDLTNRPGPQSYYLLESFLLQLLAKHLEEQGKKFLTYVVIRPQEGGRPREVDAVAFEGIDDIEGPTVVDIKSARFGQTRTHVTSTIEWLNNVVSVGKFKSALLLVGGQLSERARRWLEEDRNRLNGATLHVWDEKEINTLINKHHDFAERLLSNIDAIRLDNIVARSSNVSADKWKESRADHLRELRSAYIDNELALFLGAGVSVDAGVPNWDTLLNGLLANLIKRRNSGTITDDEIQEIVARFRVVDNPSPLMAARYLRRGLADAFADDVTNLLYESVARREKERAGQGTTWTSGAPTLQALARLCIPRRSGPGVRAVVTYNFDDLLEKQLDITSVLHRPIFREGEFESRDELAVYHVHGFLPQDRSKYSLANDRLDGLVFSEEGYHRLFGDPYSWSNLVQLALLRDATCLMIGLSLTDPNLRRLLEVSARRNDRFYHYAIMRRLGISGFMNERDGTPTVKARTSAVERFLAVHHELQEELASELGVRIIWIESYDEIPAMITSLSSSTT